MGNTGIRGIWCLAILGIAACWPLTAPAAETSRDSLGSARAAMDQALKAGAERLAVDEFASAKIWLAEAEKAYVDANSLLARINIVKGRQDSEEEITYLANMARIKSLTAEARAKTVTAGAALAATQKSLAGSRATVATMKAKLEEIEEAQRRLADLEGRSKLERASTQELAAKLAAERGKQTSEAGEQQLVAMQARLQVLEQERAMQVAAGKISGVSVKTSEGTLLFAIPAANLFRSSGDLAPGGKNILESIAEFLKAFPGNGVLVKGHTDNRGKPAANQTLSEKRAQLVCNYFVMEAGVPADAVTANGLGAAEPVADNATVAGRALNSRVEVQVSRKR